MAEAAPPASRTADTRPASTATFREIFAISEFRAVWLADLTSIAGDQFARVALTLLVYDQTRSALLTAVTYAATYLPWLIGGLVLSDLADRYPRRNVMITADLMRMVMVAAMVLPGMPLWGMIVLLFAVTTLNAPFQGARSALRATILPGDRYPLGVAVSQITRQAGIVGGFVAGGVIVTGVGARPALLIDAGTFLFSALVLTRVRAHPTTPAARSSRLGEMLAGVTLVFGDRRLRALMLLAWLAAFCTLAEPLAVPYAARLGHGGVAAGLIFAAGPLGSAIGSAMLTRLVRPHARMRLMGPMAVASGLILVACLAGANLGFTLLILALAGVAGGYQVAANAAFIVATPDSRRGQAYALANAGLMISQGVVYVAAGAAVALATPAIVVAVGGAVGAVGAGWLLLGWRRSQWGDLTSDDAGSERIG